MTPVPKQGSNAFNSVQKYAEQQGPRSLVPREGDALLPGGATVTILHCRPEAIDDGRTNDSSIAVPGISGIAPVTSPVTPFSPCADCFTCVFVTNVTRYQ